MARQTTIQKQINTLYGTRRNMNGAGSGGRFVAKRNADGSISAGRSQLGNRSQRAYDIRKAFSGMLGISVG